MQIVGLEQTNHGGQRVHTIDVWFSGRRHRWLVERLDVDGHQIGLTHSCASEAEAIACLEEWLRTHSETHLVAPRSTTAAERRLPARRPQSRAA